MLKRVLDSLDGLSDEVKGFYKEVDGKFILQVDGKDAEDVTALKNAKDHEKNLRTAAEGKVATLTADVERVTGERDAAIGERDAARAEKGTDVATLEASWKQKVEDEKTAHGATKAKLESEIDRILLRSTAKTMATEISTVPELFEDVIAKRLKVEVNGEGEHFVRVLDETGQPSAQTVEELKAALLANEKYAAIIISGKGSGGGANGSGSGGGAPEKKWLEYSDEELVALRKNDPAKYDRLKQAHQASAN